MKDNSFTIREHGVFFIIREIQRLQDGEITIKNSKKGRHDRQFTCYAALTHTAGGSMRCFSIRAAD